MLTLLVVILHDTSCLPDLLEAWKKAGVPGVTIMESVGGFQAQKLLKRSGLPALLNLFEQNVETQRFILSLINNQDKLDQAISEADRVVGGFDRPQSGILFTLPVGQALGLQKRRILDDEEIVVPKKEEDNLLTWFQEEIKENYGAEVIADWDALRKKKVSEIKLSEVKPIPIIRAEAGLDEVLEELKKNPESSFACVINSEERLVGLLDCAALVEMKLIPAMPKKFIQDPEGYEQALKYVRKYPKYTAGDVMGKAEFVVNQWTIEEAFGAFHTSGRQILPLVNKHYRVKGSISLLDLV